MAQEVDDSHVLFVVHGIGDHTRRLKDIEPLLQKNRDELVQKLGIHKKVHIIPIEWHTALRDQTSEADKILETVTPPGLEFLRCFTNHTLIDVFYFQSPQYRELFYQEAAIQLNTHFANFLAQRDNWKGKVSILSHSLGSVICFDLLCNQLKDKSEGGNVSYWRENRSKQSDSPNTNQPTEYEYEKGGKKVSCQLGNPMTQTLRDDFPQLLFCVENLFLIGSPLSLFMAVRGDHNNKALVPHCTNIYNIIHPYDPVSYRIEPLIHTAFTPLDPVILKHHATGGARTHINLMNKMKNINIGWGWQAKSENDNNSESDVSVVRAEPNSQEIAHAMTMIANLFGGNRYDFVIQLGIADPRNWSAYSAATGAHTSYWGSKDIMLFILERMFHIKE